MLRQGCSRPPWAPWAVHQAPSCSRAGSQHRWHLHGSSQPCLSSAEQQGCCLHPRFSGTVIPVSFFLRGVDLQGNSLRRPHLLFSSCPLSRSPLRGVLCLFQVCNCDGVWGKRLLCAPVLQGLQGQCRGMWCGMEQPGEMLSNCEGCEGSWCTEDFGFGVPWDGAHAWLRPRELPGLGCAFFTHRGEGSAWTGFGTNEFCDIWALLVVAKSQLWGSSAPGCCCERGSGAVTAQEIPAVVEQSRDPPWQGAQGQLGLAVVFSCCALAVAGGRKPRAGESLRKTGSALAGGGCTGSWGLHWPLGAVVALEGCTGSWGLHWLLRAVVALGGCALLQFGLGKGVMGFP